MLRLLYKIWPSTIPIALLLLWYLWKRRRAKKQPDAETPKLKDEPWQLTLIVAGLIAIACLFIGVAMQETVQGDYDYVPATIQDGKIQGGKIHDGDVAAPH